MGIFELRQQVVPDIQSALNVLRIDSALKRLWKIRVLRRSVLNLSDGVVIRQIDGTINGDLNIVEQVSRVLFKGNVIKIGDFAAGYVLAERHLWLSLNPSPQLTVHRENAVTVDDELSALRIRGLLQDVQR